MKRLKYAALGVGGLIALSFALAVVLIDGARVREAIGARMEATLGQPVELGDVELSLFPLPAARILDARIGTPGAPRLEARAIRVGVSLPALLAGRVVLRSLELDSPQLDVPASARTASASAARAASLWDAGRTDDVEIAITSLAVRGGTLQLGAERLEEIELSGGLDLTLGASFEFSASAPGIGRIEDGSVEIEGLTGEPAGWTWKADARLAELDLTALRERLDFRSLWGKAEGKLSAAGTGASAERVRVELESQDFEVRGTILRMWGPTQLAAEYPARTLDVDLTQAQVSVGQLEKPSGVALRVSAGEIERQDAGLRVGAFRIESDALRSSGELEIRAGRPEIEIESGALDLGALATAWKRPDWMPRAGRLDLESLRFNGDPLALRADGALSKVQIQLPSSVPIELDGPVFLDGATFGGDGIGVKIAGETVSMSLRYDWSAKRIQLGLLTEGLRIGPFLQQLTKFDRVSGRLYARLEVSGPPDLYALKGQGEFDLVDGEWKGFSLAQAALRAPPEDQVARPAPPQRIRGRLEVDEDEVRLVEGIIEQEDAQAKLTGLLYLRDLVVDLAGELTVFSPELEQPLVLPILKVGGTLNAMSMSVGNAETPEVREAEANMVEAFRKAEREARQKEREKRKQSGSSDG